jgi:hypothetical protein
MSCVVPSALKCSSSPSKVCSLVLNGPCPFVHAYRGADIVTNLDEHLVRGCTLCRSDGKYFFVERRPGGDALMGNTDESPGPASWTDAKCYFARDEVEVERGLRQHAVKGLTLIALPEGQHVSRGMAVEGIHGSVGRGELRAIETQDNLYKVNLRSARMHDVMEVFHEL